MLVRITNNCTMGCTHCLVDANPTGEHMSWDTYRQVISFIKECGPPHLVMLSGGEPSEHPTLTEFLEHAKANQLLPLLLSNGEFLWQKPELRDRVLPLVYSVQVTNDPRYYPRRVAEFEHEKVCHVDRITHLTPQGRACSLATDRRAPGCFNMRSCAHVGKSFREARLMLMTLGKFCTPSVNIDGSISAGESSLCSKVGSVRDDHPTVMANLVKLRCQKCGLVNSLGQVERTAIGE